MRSSDIVYNIVVISNGLEEFKDFIYHRSKKLGLTFRSVISLGVVSKMLIGEYQKPLPDDTTEKRYRECHMFHYAEPGKPHAIRAPRIDSWEIWGTGEQRVDFQQIMTVCKNRWIKQNPCRSNSHVKPFHLQTQQRSFKG